MFSNVKLIKASNVCITLNKVSGWSNSMKY